MFVAGDDAVDQYHVSHRESFFGQAVEQAVVDPASASIQLGHLLCDRRDLSSTSQPAPATPGELVQRVYVYDFVEGGDDETAPSRPRSRRIDHSWSRGACSPAAATRGAQA